MIPARESYLSELKSVSQKWLPGFKPIYRKELAYWFKTYR